MIANLKYVIAKAGETRGSRTAFFVFVMFCFVCVFVIMLQSTHTGRNLKILDQLIDLPA